ncbi:MAG: hypothetical protein H6739_07755 [Alphaproteobacteria bacterium]|nr:hypothetical protein [Alphaproteobacteria bacterium]
MTEPLEMPEPEAEIVVLWEPGHAWAWGYTRADAEQAARVRAEDLDAVESPTDDEPSADVWVAGLKELRVSVPQLGLLDLLGLLGLTPLGRPL